MSQGNQSVLRFSIEESVWFQKGQEVDELISISIDPDITIQDNDLYVSIQGALELTGEYRCHKNEEEEEEKFPIPKFIQHVEEREGGICEFSHRFPVDISIPNNRVQSVYDIDVEVASFDYSFPERSLMKLTAEVTISGLYDEESGSQNEIEEDLNFRPYSSQTEEEEESIDEPVHFNRTEENPVTDFQKSEYDLHPFSRPSLEEEHPVDEHLGETGVTEHKEEWSTPFEAVARKVPETESEINGTDVEEDQFKNEIPIVQVNPTPEVAFLSAKGPELVGAERNKEEIKIEVEIQEESSSKLVEESESSSSENLLKKKLFAKKKKSLTLSEFFARKEEQPDLTRLKVCIVQSGETLNQLAERYDVAVQQLMRVNQLEFNQEVSAGQVLYIPVTVARS
ncbi:stage VI sporulation protein D [Cytobacillus sp. Hz8]|uniref:stage VI sporulation protein D n=1 Tax=Cytobacillus sp. Hz8 TaxID=3347168 RepID=UPI0035D5456D